jgi:hypothetical protein
VAKLLLLSVVIAVVAVPLIAGQDRNPRRGLNKTLLVIFFFNLFYLFAVRFIYPHLV